MVSRNASYEPYQDADTAKLFSHVPVRETLQAPRIVSRENEVHAPHWHCCAPMKQPQRREELPTLERLSP